MKPKILSISDGWELYKFLDDIYPEDASSYTVNKLFRELNEKIVSRDPDGIFTLLNLLIDTGTNKIEDIDRTVLTTVLLESFVSNSVHELVVFFREVTGKW